MGTKAEDLEVQLSKVRGYTSRRGGRVSWTKNYERSVKEMARDAEDKMGGHLHHFLGDEDGPESMQQASRSIYKIGDARDEDELHSTMNSAADDLESAGIPFPGLDSLKDEIGLGPESYGDRNEGGYGVGDDVVEHTGKGGRFYDWTGDGGNVSRIQGDGKTVMTTWDGRRRVVPSDRLMRHSYAERVSG